MAETIDSDDCGNTNIETKQCAAYDVPSLIRQKVLIESNPAYEEIIRFSAAT